MLKTVIKWPTLHSMQCYLQLSWHKIHTNWPQLSCRSTVLLLLSYWKVLKAAIQPQTRSVKTGIFQDKLLFSICERYLLTCLYWVPVLTYWNRTKPGWPITTAVETTQNRWADVKPPKNHCLKSVILIDGRKTGFCSWLMCMFFFSLFFFLCVFLWPFYW